MPSGFTLTEDLGWHADAVCLTEGVAVDVFFPVDTNRIGRPRKDAVASDSETIELARSYCARCPVREDCRDYALAHRIWDGVWGGLTGDELMKLHRRRQRK